MINKSHLNYDILGKCCQMDAQNEAAVRLVFYQFKQTLKKNRFQIAFFFQFSHLKNEFI